MTKLICFSCEDETQHEFIGINPDTGESLYRCSVCDEGVEIDEREPEDDELPEKFIINRSEMGEDHFD